MDVVCIWVSIACLAGVFATATARADNTGGTVYPQYIASPADIPADAVIGRIEIRIDEVFDLSDSRENVALYRLADALHWRTREEAIAAQLLFSSGEPFSQRKLEETERALRANGYLASAVARPTARRGREVDVQVRVRDVWTLMPEVSFGRQGGQNQASLALQDANFLGTGKSITFAHRHDVERRETGVEYLDPNVFGSHWRAGLGYFDNSDGHSREVAVGRPFFALDTPWSAGIDFQEDDREQPRYALGEEVDRLRSRRERIRLEGGFSTGYESGWTRRWLFGVARDDARFAAVPESALAAPLPEDRHFLYPWIGWEVVEDDFIKTSNLTQIGRTEDLYLGTSARLELGFSPGRHDTPRTALFAARAQTGRTWPDTRHVLHVQSDISGRWSTDGLDNTLANASAEYFWRASDRHVWYARLGGSLAHELDGDSQVLLGGDSGLRGYPLRYQAGTASALLTLEHRYYSGWYPFRLARVGGAVFFDMGRTWGPDVAGNEPLGLLKDVGFGVRLGNARSSHGSTIHLDLAFPLDRQPGIDSMQFLIQTRKSF